MNHINKNSVFGCRLELSLAGNGHQLHALDLQPLETQPSMHAQVCPTLLLSISASARCFVSRSPAIVCQVSIWCSRDISPRTAACRESQNAEDHGDSEVAKGPQRPRPPSNRLRPRTSTALPVAETSNPAHRHCRQVVMQRAKLQCCPASHLRSGAGHTHTQAQSGSRDTTHSSCHKQHTGVRAPTDTVRARCSQPTASVPCPSSC